MVVSTEPYVMYLPSGEKATESTQWVCACNDSQITLPDFSSRTRMVLSTEPDAIRMPSGEKATEETQVCPKNGYTCSHIPNADGHVSRSGGNLHTVGGEYNGIHPAGVTSKWL